MELSSSEQMIRVGRLSPIFAALRPGYDRELGLLGEKTRIILHHHSI